VPLHFYDDDLQIKFESRVGDPLDSWLRLQYVINDYWTGDPHQIDDKVFLATTRPRFGGVRCSEAIRPMTQHRVRAELAGKRVRSPRPVSRAARFPGALLSSRAVDALLQTYGIYRPAKAAADQIIELIDWFQQN